MADFPREVTINEEGPREGFQFEKGPIPTARKIELIDALSRTGVRTIQMVSFVNPKAVPGMADADEVVAGITMQPGVSYVGLWLNEKGLERAIATGRLEIKGQITMVASESFLKRNQNVTIEQQTGMQHSIMRMYKARGIEVSNAVISAAFGCNFEGDIPVDRVLRIIGQAFDIA